MPVICLFPCPASERTWRWTSWMNFDVSLERRTRGIYWRWIVGVARVLAPDEPRTILPPVIPFLGIALGIPLGESAPPEGDAE